MNKILLFALGITALLFVLSSYVMIVPSKGLTNSNPKNDQTSIINMGNVFDDIRMTNITTKIGASSNDDLYVSLNFPVIPAYYGSSDPEYYLNGVIADSSGIYVFVNVKSEDPMFNGKSIIMKLSHDGNLLWSYISVDDSVSMRNVFMCQDSKYVYIIGKRVIDNKLLVLKVDKTTGHASATLFNIVYPGTSDGIDKGYIIFNVDYKNWLTGDLVILIPPSIFVDYDKKEINYTYDSRFTDDFRFTTYYLTKMTNGNELVIRSENYVTNGGYDVLVRVYNTTKVAKDFYFFGTQGNDFLLTYWPHFDGNGVFIVPMMIDIKNVEGYFTLISFNKTTGEIMWSKLYVLPLNEYQSVKLYRPTQPVSDGYSYLINMYPNLSNDYNQYFVYNVLQGKFDGQYLYLTIQVVNPVPPETLETYTYYQDSYEPELNKEYMPDYKQYNRNYVYTMRIDPKTGNIVDENVSSNNYYNVGVYSVLPLNINSPYQIMAHYLEENGDIVLLYLYNKRIYIVETSVNSISLYNFDVKSYPVVYGIGVTNAFSIMNINVTRN